MTPSPKGMKVTLKCEYDYEGQSNQEIEHTIYGPDLIDLLEAFQTFAKGCGYEFTGEIDIIDEKA